MDLFFNFRKEYCYLFFVTLFSIVLSTRGIFDEGVISQNGDMPRYMMNGVFVYDYFVNGMVQNPFEFAKHYFATYPALSLGHHPLLTAFTLFPFYAIFGISVFSAKLMMVCFSVFASASFFFLVKMLYDETVAFLAALLFLSNGFIVHLSSVVMSEIPACAFMFLTAYHFFRYLRVEKKSNLIAFVLFLFFSLFAKQTTIVMLPFYCICFARAKGWQVIFTWKVAICATILAVGILPIALMTLKFSQLNVGWTVDAIRSFLDPSRFITLFEKIWRSLLSIQLVLLCLVSVTVVFWQRKKQSMLVIGCMFWMYLFFVLTNAPSSRHMVYLIPLACILAASLVTVFQKRKYKIFCSSLLLVVFAYQFAIAYGRELEYSYGYETAAKYVDANWKGESVLYASSVDTGYFVFFFRKHTHHDNRVIIRADKILATSIMGHIIDDRIKDRQEIYAVLQKYGIGQIVVEDHDLGAKPLNWLRDELRHDNFVLRKRIRVTSNDIRLKQKYLNIYEYRGYIPADADALLELRIPLIKDTIKIRFGNLIGQFQTEESSDQN